MINHLKIHQEQHKSYGFLGQPCTAVPYRVLQGEDLSQCVYIPTNAMSGIHSLHIINAHICYSRTRADMSSHSFGFVAGTQEPQSQSRVMQNVMEMMG